MSFDEHAARMFAAAAGMDDELLGASAALFDDAETPFAGSEPIAEGVMHEAAFTLVPHSGVLQPRQRQTVTVHFAPSIAHIRYCWAVQLHTADMARSTSFLTLSSGGLENCCCCNRCC